MPGINYTSKIPKSSRSTHLKKDRENNQELKHDSTQYYSGIDEMPLFNWRKCQEKGDYKYARISIENGSDLLDEFSWKIIYDTYLEEFGFTSTYVRIMELQHEIAELQCDFIIQDRRFILNKIKMLEGELSELVERPNESDMDQAITYISKWLGFRINPKETTVREFFKYVRDYEKEVEAMKKNK